MSRRFVECGCVIDDQGLVDDLCGCHGKATSAITHPTAPATFLAQNGGSNEANAFQAEVVAAFTRASRDVWNANLDAWCRKEVA